MKISSIKTNSVSIPLVKPSKFALGIREKADHVITQIDADEGIKGFGEVSPFSPFCSETKTSVINLLQETFLPF